MTGVKKVLIAVTSYNGEFYPDGKKTGIFVVEALHPYEVFIANGYQVDFISEDGKYGWDEHSVAEPYLTGKDLETFHNKSSPFMKAMESIKTPFQVNGAEYEIFFASAGHGTLFDYPNAKGLQSLAAQIYDNGGAVGAVCHGFAIFDGLIEKKTGKPLIEGKAYTGFTSIGEVLLKIDGVMKEKNLLFVEDLAEKYHAKYLSPLGPWDDFSIADGRVITGVNPQSAHSTALRCIKALKEKHGHHFEPKHASITKPPTEPSQTEDTPQARPSNAPSLPHPTLT